MTGLEKKHKVAIALGANLVNPHQAIDRAVEMLASVGVSDIICSQRIVTAPVGCVPGTPDFVNCALTGRWLGSPLELLNACQQIEQELGRPVEHRSDEARVIDLDILLYDEDQIRTERLIVPHPRMVGRRFVIQPLAEIAGDWKVPGEGTVAKIMAEMPIDI